MKARQKAGDRQKQDKFTSVTSRNMIPSCSRFSSLTTSIFLCFYIKYLHMCKNCCNFAAQNMG